LKRTAAKKRKKSVPKIHEKRRKSGMSDTRPDPLAKIKQKLELEIRAIERELVDELPKEIAKARAHGDLSENAEYKYAKERQAYLNAKIGQLKKRMGDVSMLNVTNLPKDAAAYGSRVWILDIQKSVEVEYKLVTTEESDAANGLISTTSPIGKALLGRRVGDEIKVQTPVGIKEFEVVKLKTIHEEE
jgi:transcription elongation factor GreA